MTMLILLFLIQAVSGYLFGPSEVTGAIGGSVMVSCHYNPISANIHGRKFWCKVIKKQCITIISTNNYIAQNYINRTYLQNHRDNFKINMTHLQQKDSGIYRCGIGNHNDRFFYAVNVTVSEGNKIPYTSEVIIANHKGSITINCPVPQKPHTGWKYWCKMSKMDVPSCDIMVNSSGYVHQNFWGRVLIQEVFNTTDFKILVNNIKMDDFGFYRCGTGKFDDGSNWTDIHIHILNSKNKIQYQISKSFTRSPGGEFVAQCWVPTSFKSILLIYWCRWNETGCLRLVDSDGFIQKGFQNRISLNNTTKMSTVILTQLDLGDTGYYWCIITDGQRVETSSVEVYIIETTTALYSKVSIKQITSGETFSSAVLLTTTSIPETHMNVIFRPTSVENLTSTLNLNHTVLNTEMSKSRAKQGFYNTTRLNQIGGTSILQITSAYATNHVQNSISTASKNHATTNIVKDTSSLLPTNRNMVLTSSPTEQENTTWLHFITADNNQTVGSTIVLSSAVPAASTNGTQESTSTTSYNQATGSIVEYISSFLPTSRDKHLTHSTTIEQETTEELYTRTSSRWRISNKVYLPFTPILTTDSGQETQQNVTPRLSDLENLAPTLHPNHTVLNPETSKSRAEQENTTWHHFITADNNQTGEATMVQSSVVPATATNGNKETQQNVTPRPSDLKNLPSTLHLNQTVLNPETSKSRAKQESYQNVTPRPSDLENLPSTLHPNHTVLNPETSKSRVEQENTTWRHFITADNNQTRGATIVQSSVVSATATHGNQESYQKVTPRPSDPGNLPSTLHLNHTVLNPETSKSRVKQENTTWRHFITADNNQTGGATIVQSSVVSATATHGNQGIEDNYGMTTVHKPNSEVTLIEDSTREPQSKLNKNESSSERQVSSSKNLILVLIPVLAISCVIGFATLIYVVMNVRKKRATNTIIHHQEIVLMMDKGAEEEENTEQHELSVLELTSSSNLFRETEV
ncbi:uncharacterized protein LOC122932493 isoform X1 [Bufo gargarizans]|uniref:uncharacterized protein LOC122932493 isoform X1 n=1 Tax=Bufo gargarizans TaxID=30331 RepID=UPI001CF15830|nr:uncharacterized protein LOC122932493 isoform X1 [Bufo gargarizans]